MLNDKQNILDNNDFLNERKSAKNEIKYNRTKRINLLISVILSITIIAVIYLLLPVSNIYRIAVDGNIYLRSEDIIKDSGISTSSKYIFVNTTRVENNIKNNALIDECHVELLDDRIVRINVVEKKAIGYTFEENENVLVLADDSRLVLNKENLYLIEYVPLLEGFTKEQLILIEKNFSDVDYRLINEISEIHYYPLLKFQDHEIIMRDGNYMFTSVYGMNLINRYHSMASTYNDEINRCFYVEDISGNAYISACPWEPKEEEKNLDSTLDDAIGEDE